MERRLYIDYDIRRQGWWWGVADPTVTFILAQGFSLTKELAVRDSTTFMNQSGGDYGMNALFITADGATMMRSVSNTHARVQVVPVSTIGPTVASGPPPMDAPVPYIERTYEYEGMIDGMSVFREVILPDRHMQRLLEQARRERDHAQNKYAQATQALLNIEEEAEEGLR